MEMETEMEKGRLAFHSKLRQTIANLKFVTLKRGCSFGRREPINLEALCNLKFVVLSIFVQNFELV